MFGNQELINLVETIDPYHKASRSILFENEDIASNRKNDLVRDRTERVGSDFGGEELFDFLSRSDGGSCLNKKNSGRRNAISIYIPVANSFTPERAFFVTKLPFRDAKFLANRDRVPLQNSPFRKVEIWLAFFAFRGR